MMIVSQMKRLNDHEVTFKVDRKPGEEVQSFLVLGGGGPKTMVGETLTLMTDNSRNISLL